jgi:hypothetical protein
MGNANTDDNKAINCCKQGNEYVKWILNEFYWDEEGDTTYWTGWGMMVDADCYYDGADYHYRPVKYCPFCGTKLEN